MSNYAKRNNKILTILRKRVLKLALRKGKKLQKEVVLLSNMYSNSLNDIVNSFKKENVISHCQNRNTISLQLPTIKRDRVAGNFEPEKRIEGANGDMSDVSFFYRRIIKCY